MPKKTKLKSSESIELKCVTYIATLTRLKTELQNEMSKECDPLLIKSFDSYSTCEKKVVDNFSTKLDTYLEGTNLSLYNSYQECVKSETNKENSHPMRNKI
ncbi:MAG: hypothetical protein A3F11_06785 [Gammaproteobacteria bacterium RIFCSPHIGHO2_12_FULL_37_14]|nr:MAG: hypothetical protein A3F11_06785 [Gammaproteobacteria bacterium RIFCSPHIGHO2_12_FULL_37_14]